MAVSAPLSPPLSDHLDGGVRPVHETRRDLVERVVEARRRQTETGRAGRTLTVVLLGTAGATLGVSVVTGLAGDVSRIARFVSLVSLVLGSACLVAVAGALRLLLLSRSLAGGDGPGGRHRTAAGLGQLEPGELRSLAARHDQLDRRCQVRLGLCLILPLFAASAAAGGLAVVVFPQW